MTYAVVKESLADRDYLLELGDLAQADASSVTITGGTITGITDLAIADGGTGASTAAAARTNLGLGTIATQAAASVTITGGTIDGVTIGGTTEAAGTFTAMTCGTADFNSGGITVDANFLDVGAFDSGGSTDGKRWVQATGLMRSSRSGGGSSTHHQFYDGTGLAGSIVTDGSGNTAYNTTSDERLKHDRAALADPQAIIDAIPVGWYTMNGKRQRGFQSAQALARTFPEAVTQGEGEPGDENFVPWSIDPGRVVAVCVATLQRQAKRIEELERVINGL